ncbi:LysR substrate-binding domain-containing protein [Pseudacidovorax intermedius]|uniref:LysR family transcriptional regulator n=1 Tax=Pseudacidovorax intermedius TaxID=433924 RepID=A0A370FA39_9BURK|nr:LysR substrate-binding domain-containing protein [Pseudacidovorax intermedius]RDI22010.1 LysR family transcriptional regulator [Pseudacidovorax intermedius]
MIRELKTFIAIAEEGTFVRAGQRIGLTQAAVSAQMQRLEEQLGHALFIREGRTARLNPQGLNALAQAREVVRLFDDMAAQSRSRPLSGRLSLGAIASAQSRVLPRVLMHFRAQHPGVHVRVVPGVSFQLLNQVDAGELDAAIMIRPVFGLQADLAWTPLTQEPFWLLVPTALPESEDWRGVLATQPFIRYDRTSFGGRLVERFLRDACLSVQDCVEIDELDAIAQMVACGMGVSLVPQSFGKAPWPDGVRAVSLGEHTFFREIGLVTRTRSSPAPALLDLLQLIGQAYTD